MQWKKTVMQILIVEDNPKNLKLIRDVLVYKGYQVGAAKTAEAGVAIASEQHPALILMDIQMPGMDGIEAMKILKADKTTEKIPIIAVTSLAMKGDKEKLLADGFNGYLAKPIDIKELPKIIDTYLRSEE